MDLPIVCTLTPGELQQRKASLPGVLARASHLDVLTDGYRARFSLSDGLLRDVAAMLDAERRCCRFLRFQLTIEPDEGPVVLDVTGPPGTRDFLAAIIDPSA